ncbi:MAG TPA: DUF6074 family protein [Devosia sp.]|nr:DUF6074 family protein [Devosia sp.]
MQLELFDRRPAEPALVIAFPMSRRIGEARAAVDKVSSKATDAQRQATFCKALGGLAARLAKSGLDAQQVDRQLDAFTDLVNAELWLREGRQRPTGGAA